MWGFTLVLIACTTARAAFSPRIVGGELVNSDTRFSYQVAFRNQVEGAWFSYCGGTIIDSTHIVTAAHCFYVEACPSSANWADRVTTGRISQPVPSELYEMEAVYLHPLWRPQQLTQCTTSDIGRGVVGHHDIAIVKLRTELQFSDSLGPLPLATSDCADCQAEAASYIVSGFGHHFEGDQTETRYNLSYAELTHEPCPLNSPEYGQGALCALHKGDSTPADTCQGDSGGPLALLSESGDIGPLVGVVSGAPGCARPGVPGGYTSVMVERNWIDSVLAGEMEPTGTNGNDFVCNDAPVPSLVTAPCTTQLLSWEGAATPCGPACTARYMGGENPQTLLDSEGITTGSVVATCVNGTIQLSEASCTSSVSFCPTLQSNLGSQKTLSWQVADDRFPAADQVFHQCVSVEQFAQQTSAEPASTYIAASPATGSVKVLCRDAKRELSDVQCVEPDLGCSNADGELVLFWGEGCAAYAPPSMVHGQRGALASGTPSQGSAQVLCAHGRYYTSSESCQTNDAPANVVLTFESEDGSLTAAGMLQISRDTNGADKSTAYELLGGELAVRQVTLPATPGATIPIQFADDNVLASQINLLPTCRQSYFLNVLRIGVSIGFSRNASGVEDEEPDALPLYFLNREATSECQRNAVYTLSIASTSYDEDDLQKVRGRLSLTLPTCSASYTSCSPTSPCCVSTDRCRRHARSGSCRDGNGVVQENYLCVPATTA